MSTGSPNLHGGGCRRRQSSSTPDDASSKSALLVRTMYVSVGRQPESSPEVVVMDSSAPNARGENGHRLAPDSLPEDTRSACGATYTNAAPRESTEHKGNSRTHQAGEDQNSLARIEQSNGDGDEHPADLHGRCSSTSGGPACGRCKRPPSQTGSSTKMPAIQEKHTDIDGRMSEKHFHVWRRSQVGCQKGKGCRRRSNASAFRDHPARMTCCPAVTGNPAPANASVP